MEISAEVPRVRAALFFEFYEWVEWEHGNDPQYRKYIPVPTVEDAQMLRKASQADLLLFSPSLNVDFPRDADASTIYWAGKSPSRPLPASAPVAALSGAAGDTAKKSSWHCFFVKAIGTIHSTQPSG